MCSRGLQSSCTWVPSLAHRTREHFRRCRALAYFVLYWAWPAALLIDEIMIEKEVPTFRHGLPLETERRRGIPSLLRKKVRYDCSSQRQRPGRSLEQCLCNNPWVNLAKSCQMGIALLPTLHSNPRWACSGLLDSTVSDTARSSQQHDRISKEVCSFVQQLPSRVTECCLQDCQHAHHIITAVLDYVERLWGLDSAHCR